MPTLMLRETLISYDNRYEHYSVPAHIRNISANCFNERWELQWLTLPEHLEELGDNAFRMCINLKRIDMPVRIEKVGRALFSYCRNLKSVSLPEGVEEIDYEMFRECGALQEIVLPDSVERIHGSAFSSCGSLKYLSCGAEVFALLPEKVQPATALTYLERKGKENSRLPEIFERYVQEKKELLLEMGIRRNDVRGMQYLLENSDPDGELLRNCQEIAQRNHRTEIGALILEAMEKNRESASEDALDWDPFGDL